MDTPSTPKPIAPATQPEAAQPWLTVDRAISCSAIMLLLFITFFVLGAMVSDGFTSRTMTGPGSDFSVFWGA